MFANKGEEIQTSNSKTLSEMHAKAVVRLARIQKDLVIVSSLEESKEITRRSWLTSSSVLLALHSPMLASLLHPGADCLSLPFDLPTIDSLLAWLHGEVNTMGEEVEEAAEWLGIHINKPADEKSKNPPQIMSCQYQGHLLIERIFNSVAGNDSENKEMEEPECVREEVREHESNLTEDFENISANDTFDALNFDFRYFCGEGEKATEPEASLTCGQCWQFVCDQCGYRGTVEEDLMEHRNSLHRFVHYSCNQCDYESARSDDLTKHMHSQHESVLLKLFANVFRN